MLRRHVYRSIARVEDAGKLKEAVQMIREELEASLRDAGAVCFALFQWEHRLFAYVETEEGPFQFAYPDRLNRWLLSWPGEEEARYAVPMLDIFHDGVPEDRDSWRTGRTVEERAGRLARLRPEQYASYIFYHYQMQEEKPESFNKTYLIATHETLIFSYSELPASVSAVPKRGKLNTSLTPSNWHELMEPHFVPWTDTAPEERLWRKLELLLAFE